MINTEGQAPHLVSAPKSVKKRPYQNAGVVVTVHCKDVRAPIISFASSSTDGYNAAVGES